MGRQQTQLAQKSSPHASRFQKVASARYAKASQRSPLAAVYPSARTVRTALQSANSNRLLKFHSQLAPIREEPALEGTDEEEATIHGSRRELHREFDAFERDEDLGYRKHAHTHDEDDSMDWDDESTLVAMLQETSEVDEQEEMAALANKLKAPMAAQGSAMREYLGETLLPVIARVKEVHAVLEDKVDLAFGAGILTFDEVCKKAENMALHDEGELKIAYTDCQRNMQQVLNQLQQAYARRDGLWATLQEDVDKCVERAKAVLEALPTEAERAIALLERKARELDKESSTNSKQKMFKGLLEKL